MPWLQLILPLLLAGLQYVRREQAQRVIDQEQEAQIPAQKSQIQESLIQRGLGGSSYFENASQYPARQFAIARRVGQAQNLLATPTVDPLAAGFALWQQLNQQQGGVPQAPDYNLVAQAIPRPRYYPWGPY